VLQRLSDIVQTVQQQMFAKRVDVEVNLLAARSHHNLALQIDSQARVAAELRIVDQRIADRAWQSHRQDAILEAVVEENVGEVRSDDTADAEIEQCPGCMFTRGAAAEVLVGDDDLRAAVRFLVQHELRAFLALGVVAQCVEQVHAEAGAFDRLEESRGDDLVGVDIRDR
jgi:hypothetical protein